MNLTANPRVALLNDFAAFEEASWQLLEPIMLVEATAPSEFQGAVISMINKRSGIMLSQEGSAHWFTLYAEASKRRFRSNT